MNYLKYRFHAVIFLIYLITPSSANAAELYSEAIATAKENCGYTGSATVDPKWLASSSSIISINSSDTHGLKYDATGKLITRTASSYGSFLSTMYTKTDFTYRSDKQPYDDNAAWVTTGNDTTRFLTDNSASAGTAVKLLERGLGMNDTGTHTVMIEYAVSADNDHLLRPTKNSDITTYNSGQYGNSDVNYPFSKPAGMSDQTYADYQTFYATHVTGSYTGPADNQFPFTQLGYTYFWGNGDTPPPDVSQIQGMSEFIILPKTNVNVVGIYSMQSYVYTSNKNGGFSTDSDAQYGNGFASFNIDGDCATVWAGHRFQINTRHSASDPNRITVESGCTISGGEGILVWSLNYLIDNSGTITTDGATKKFFIDGTDSIAILFEGDTTTEYGPPVTGGVNKVINSGTIKGTAAGAGTGIKILAGDSIIENSGTIAGTTAIEVSGGTASVTNTGTISGGITLTAGTAAALDVGTGNVAFSGAYTQGSGTTLKVTAGSSASYGKVTPGALSSLDAASSVVLTVSGYIPNNSDFTVVDTSGAGVGAVPGTLTTTSPIFSISGSAATNDLVLTATRANTYNTFASNPNAGAAGSVLESVGASGASGDMLTILNNLDSLTSGSQIDQALNSLTPNTDNSGPQTVQATLTQFLSTVFAHLDAFKNVTGDTVKGPDVWASTYGSYLHQDPMGASNGYNATIWAAALGCDFPAADRLRVGMSGGFAQDFIRTKDSSARTDIDSYQGSVYGSYARGAYYVDTALSFAYNSYDASRHVAVGNIDRIANGDYNGQQYSAYIGGGYKFTAKNIELTPQASFQYMHLRLNSYTENGAGAANLNVTAQDYDFAQTGVGMKLGYPVTLPRQAGRLTPELKFKWLYDWIGDAQQVTSAFTGGGGSFNTRGFTPAQSSYDLGIKLILETANFVTVSLSYDLELKEDFYGHYGLAEFRYRF